MLSYSSENFGIVGAAQYLPGMPVDIKRWGPAHGVDNTLVQTLVDNSCHYFHVSAPEEDDLSLISSAWDNLRQTCNFDIEKIAVVIHTRSQAFSVPPPPRSLTSSFLSRYNITPSLDLSLTHLACASAINALWLVTRYLRTLPSDKLGLILTSDRAFGGAPQRIRGDAGIMSDSGSAILIGQKNIQAQIARFGFGNHAQHYKGSADAEANKVIAQSGWYNTRALLDHTMSNEGITWEDVKLVLPINAYAHYWRMIERANNLPVGHVVTRNIGERGHACSSDLAINLLDFGLAAVKEGASIIACGASNLGAHATLLLSPPPSTPKAQAPVCLPELCIYDLVAYAPDVELATHEEAFEAQFENFKHLIFSDAGRHSSPPIDYTIDTTFSKTPANSKTTLSDAAAHAVRLMLEASRGDVGQITHLVNTQCTINDNRIESTCLRIQNEFFPNVQTAFTVDQMGTSGAASTFVVAQLALLDDAPDKRVCITASDKWAMPFPRHLPGMLPLADASAACIVGRAESGCTPLAEISLQNNITRSPPPLIWTAEPQALEDYILDIATEAVTSLLRLGDLDRDKIDLVAGDGVKDDLLKRLSTAVDIPQEKFLNFPFHYGSSSQFFALSAVIKQAETSRRALRCLIWSASLSGHGAAMLVNCRG